MDGGGDKRGSKIVVTDYAHFFWKDDGGYPSEIKLLSVQPFGVKTPIS